MDIQTAVQILKQGKTCVEKDCDNFELLETLYKECGITRDFYIIKENYYYYSFRQTPFVSANYKKTGFTNGDTKSIKLSEITQESHYEIY